VVSLLKKYSASHRKGGYAVYRKILVPLDGSDLAECVVPHVKTLADGCNTREIILLYVVEPIYYALVGSPLIDTVAIQEELRKKADDYLRQARSLLDKKGLRIMAEVKEGSPAKTIVDFAQENQVSLIVMATHGRSGISRWFLGSVADKVVRSSHVPVLLIPPSGSMAVIE
jgi:nucleotide-binding universal stress UspA family protein